MTAIAAEHARSWLLASGAYPETFAYLALTGPDAVILDLEDGVPAVDKADARRSVATFLDQTGAQNIWIRVNAIGTTEWEHDIVELSRIRTFGGIMLSKCESPEQIELTARRLSRRVPMIALVESALGVERAFEIATTPSTVRLAFGIGDFRRDTGAAPTPDALAYARSRLVVASRAAGIAAPIDGPTLAENRQPLIEDLQVARAIGMTGKLCLTDSQISDINRELSPSPHEVQWAQELVDASGTDGAPIRDGSDLPRLAQARRILELTDIFATEQAANSR
jgi:citrate lyase subunit beta/citryl-CoA lyase